MKSKPAQRKSFASKSNCSEPGNQVDFESFVRAAMATGKPPKAKKKTKKRKTRK